MTLFEIGDELRRVLDSVGEDGELGPGLDVWFEELASREGEKLDGYVNLIKILEAESSACRAESDAYALRAQSRERRVRALKDRMITYLQSTNRDKVQTATNRVVCVQKNGRAPSPVLAVNPSCLPERFRRVQVEVDADAVQLAVKNGEDVSEWFEVKDAGVHLRVR